MSDVDMANETVADKENQIVGVLTQTLVESPYIKKVLLFRCSSGKKSIVLIKERSIQIGSRSVPVPSFILSTTIFPLEFEDILVLVLESGLLLQLRLFDTHRDPVIIGYTRLRQSNARAGVELLGHHVAADPKGDYISVSALDERSTIFQCDKELMARSSQYSRDVMPDSSRLNLLVKDSVILDTCFLYPLPDDDTDNLYFVILHTRFGPGINFTRLTYYQWRDGQKVSPELTSTGFTLHNGITPLFMIPVNCQGGAVIVGVDKILYIRLGDVISGNHEIPTCEFHAEPVAFYHDLEYRSDDETLSDGFYLSTEEGKLYHVQVDKATVSCSLFADLGHSLGSSFVLQAFESMDGIVDGAVHEAEYVRIVCGGDMNAVQTIIFSTELDDEGKPIYKEYEQEAYESHESDIVSLLLDCQVLPNSDSRKSSSLFCCSGTYMKGAVAQINHGIKGSLFLDGPSLKSVSNLFSVLDGHGFQYLFVSYPWMTTAYMIVSNEETDFMPLFEEVPESSGLQGSQETIQVTALENSSNIIQITESEIRLTDMEGTQKNLIMGGKIIRAAVHHHFVVLALHEGGKILISLYGIEDNALVNDIWIQKLGRCVQCQSEISFLKIDPTDASCLAGTYDGRILRYGINKDGIIPFSEASGMFVEGSIPHDIVISPPGRSSDLLISLRDGTYGYYRWGADKASLHLEDEYKMSDSPVEWIQLPDDRSLVARSGGLVCVESPYVQIPVKVIMDFSKESGGVDINYMRSAITAACPFRVSNRNNPLGQQFLVVMIDNQLKIISLSNFPSRIIYKIPTVRPPRRLIYIEHISAFAVLTGGKSPYNKLTFADPHKYRQLKTELHEDVEFSREEEISSCCEWKVSINNREYRYLVIGTGFANKPFSGRVRILRVKRSSGGVIEVKYQYSWSTEGRVASILQLTDMSIFYGAGLKCFKAILCSDDKQPSFRMDVKEVCQVRSPAVDMAIYTKETTDIFIATLKDSGVMVEQFSNNEFAIKKADSVSRSSVSCLCLNESQSLISDKSGWIALLEAENEPGNCSNTFRTVFKAKMPSLVSRMREGQFSTIWGNRGKFGAPLQSARRVVAISTDGSVFGLTLLTESELQEIELHIPPDISSSEALLSLGSLMSNDYKWCWDGNASSSNVINGDRLKSLETTDLWMRKLLSSFELQ